MHRYSRNKRDDQEEQESADIEDDGKHMAGINDTAYIKIASSAPIAYV